MTQELDKNGRPKIYCKNCGKRMAHTINQQYYGTDGYEHYWYYELRDRGEVFDNRAEAELFLQRLLNEGHMNRRYHPARPLKINTLEPYNSGGRTMYFVEYSRYICEPVDYQFHSQSCMLEFLQRPDIMLQILPIIEANKAEPIIPVRQPRKKREVKIDLPDYDSMAKRLGNLPV